MAGEADLLEIILPVNPFSIKSNTGLDFVEV